MEFLEEAVKLAELDVLLQDRVNPITTAFGPPRHLGLQEQVQSGDGGYLCRGHQWLPGAI